MWKHEYVCTAVGMMMIVAMPMMLKTYAKWQARHSVKSMLDKLYDFQSIANTYTENGTAEELQKVIEDLEEVMDELQMLEDNNEAVE
jgi:hypothetical protein